MTSDYSQTHKIINKQVLHAATPKLQIIKRTLQQCLKDGRFDADRAVKRQARKAFDAISLELNARAEVLGAR